MHKEVDTWHTDNYDLRRAGFLVWYAPHRQRF